MISLDMCALVGSQGSREPWAGQALVFPGEGRGCDLQLAYGCIPS